MLFQSISEFPQTVADRISQHIHFLLTFVYQVLQWQLSQIFSPKPPTSETAPRGPHIAIIGAGITGVSSAAHCVGHGFEVTIFEAGGRENLGGIWSRVNNTSSLQIHSVMYRFHPSVSFRKKYPTRRRIIEEVTALWHRYHLEDVTRFNQRVESVSKDDETGRWIVNGERHNLFDGVIVAVGTCGEPKMIHVQGQEEFKGPIYHSSDLDGKDARGKKILVVGGGASALEAVEYAVDQQADECYILARSEKWIIPRNPFVDVLLAMDVFGQESSFSAIPEFLLRQLFYRDLKQLSPPSHSLYTETPMVNDRILEQIRQGKVTWLRGDIKKVRSEGIIFSKRDQGVPKGGPGREMIVKGDMCIMATGFHRPTLSFLPEEFFQQTYTPPNWYLQAFPVGQPAICASNCTYINAIGTVGNLHIGIYTRFLLMFLVDPSTRPTPEWMRMWIDMTRWMKMRAPGGALEFFTWSELFAWFVFSVVTNPYRWKWALFVLCGVGRALPKPT